MRLGAEKAINYRTQDFAAEIKAATGGKGVNVILDMVGGDYVPKELKCLADEGRLVFIAFLRGPKTELDINEVHAPAPDDHRLDAAPAPGRVQGRTSRTTCARRSGR